MGIDQQQYKIIEEMTQRINDVDWSFIQMIEEGKTIKEFELKQN